MPRFHLIWTLLSHSFMGNTDDGGTTKRRPLRSQQMRNSLGIIGCFVTCPSRVMVPKAGLEPARSRPRGILSPLRLPFRHFGSFWRHHPDSDWGIKVLQTSALPLGYGAITLYNMKRTRCAPHIQSRTILKEMAPMERETVCPIPRGPAIRSGAAPRRVKCYAFYCYAIRIPNG